MPRASRRYQTIFEANQSLDFEVFDAEFRRGLRHLVFFVERHGGTPSVTSNFNGFPVGRWLRTIQDNPHVVDEARRAVLLSVPGVQLSATPLRRRLTVRPIPAKTLLWTRLRAWAEDPMKDPIRARQAEAAAAAMETTD